MCGISRPGSLIFIITSRGFSRFHWVCQFAGSEIMHNKKVEIKDYSQKCDTKLKEEVYLQVIGYVDKSFVTREVV